MTQSALIAELVEALKRARNYVELAADCGLRAFSATTSAIDVLTTVDSALSHAQAAQSDGWQRINEALDALLASDDEEIKLNAEPGAHAKRLIKTLTEISFPVPRIFRHGPESVVFCWRDKFYLTISATKISGLISCSVPAVEIVAKKDPAP